MGIIIVSRPWIEDRGSVGSAANYLVSGEHGGLIVVFPLQTPCLLHPRGIWPGTLEVTAGVNIPIGILPAGQVGSLVIFVFLLQVGFQIFV